MPSNISCSANAPYLMQYKLINTKKPVEKRQSIISGINWNFKKFLLKPAMSMYLSVQHLPPKTPRVASLSGSQPYASQYHYFYWKRFFSLNLHKLNAKLWNIMHFKLSNCLENKHFLRYLYVIFITDKRFAHHQESQNTQFSKWCTYSW